MKANKLQKVVANLMQNSIYANSTQPVSIK